MTTPDDVQTTVATAIAEDVGSGDISAELIDVDTIDRAHVISRQTAVICGRPWFDEVFYTLDKEVRIEWAVNEGDRVQADQVLCRLEGRARSLLTGERTALNFLQTLSATATIAREYADEVSDTSVKILDTRKTLPGLRSAQKYAVACGGCDNHRMGLYDAILIKENHIIAAGSIENAVAQALRRFPGKMVEVEVETLEQVDAAMTAGAHRLLLDNMTNAELKQAVERVDGRIELEASGGISLENVRHVAHTGVNYISVGNLTKNVAAVDLSMRFSV
jgi:nicotinate-nucleotide pyrophosphorylase (carboxylating)